MGWVSLPGGFALKVQECGWIHTCYVQRTTHKDIAALSVPSKAADAARLAIEFDCVAASWTMECVVGLGISHSNI